MGRSYSMPKYDLLIGADPEVFLVKEGKPISAFGLIPGTKQTPSPVTLGAVQVDGMAAEFNISPAKNDTEFSATIYVVMKELKNLIPKDISLSIQAVAHFDPDYVENQPKEAKELGCDPDFNAYTLAANPRPEQHPTMRTAAGHIHLGWTTAVDPMSPKHFQMCAHMVRHLDGILGLFGVINDPDTERKKMYGKAGAFRPKSYGLEYRVLSNFWLATPALQRSIFKHTYRGFHDLAISGIDYTRWNGCDNIEEIINDNDVQAAKEICKKYHGWNI